MSENKRLEELIHVKKVSQTDLAKMLICAKQIVSGWIRGIDKISPRFQIKILEVFPDISARWFLFGEGEMLVSEEPKTENIDYREKYIEVLEKNVEINEKLVNCNCGAAQSKQAG